MGTITFSENYPAMFGREPQSSLKLELKYIPLEDRVKVAVALRSIKKQRISQGNRDPYTKKRRQLSLVLPDF